MATETMTMSPPVPYEKNTGIKTYLNFLAHMSEVLKPLDFTVAGTEERFAAYEKQIDTPEVTIHDVSGRQSEFTLEENGFQYVEHEVPQLKQCNNEAEVAALLVPATEDLVRKVTGAHKTVVFQHRIRCFAFDAKKRADNRAPAHSVHTDFTCDGAMHQLSNVIKDPVELEELKTKNRVLAINVWRPLKAIKKDPLAVCDWKTVSAEDITPCRMIFGGGQWNELGKVKWNKEQKWYTLRGQTASEPLIFKQFDSKRCTEGGMTVPHSAFVDSRWADAEVRESIEIKMFAFVKE